MWAALVGSRRRVTGCLLSGRRACWWPVGCPMAFRRTDFDLCRTAADAGRREAVARRFPQKGKRPYLCVSAWTAQARENEQRVILASWHELRQRALGMQLL